MSKRDIKDRLKAIRMCTDDSVETVIAYWLIEQVAEHLLDVVPELFRRPYYNTPLVPMLRGHADAEVLRLYAFLCGWALCKGCRAVGKKKLATCSNELCEKPLTDGLSIRGLEDLKNHRDVVGHPLTWHLDRTGIRKFVDTKRDRFDVRPALLWDIHRSIVDTQIAAGASATVLDVTITPYRTGVVHSILSLCTRPGVSPFDETTLVESMTKLWKKARVQFEKYPDGQVPRPTDAELKATFPHPRDGDSQGPSFRRRDEADQRRVPRGEADPHYPRQPQHPSPQVPHRRLR